LQNEVSDDSVHFFRFGSRKLPTRANYKSQTRHSTDPFYDGPVDIAFFHEHFPRIGRKAQLHLITSASCLPGPRSNKIVPVRIACYQHTYLMPTGLSFDIENAPYPILQFFFKDSIRHASTAQPNIPLPFPPPCIPVSVAWW
jgi:hypothetical protein